MKWTVAVCAISAALSLCSAEEKAEPKHDEKNAVHLSAEAVKLADLALEPAAKGVIYKTVQAPGEIALNADRISHVSAKASGSVIRVLKSVGETVNEGEVLALIESAELGNAKIEYFTATLNLNLAKLDAEREKLIHDNTARLLEVLAQNLSPEELEKSVSTLELGEIKSKVISSYSALTLARASLSRAEKLREDKLVSGAAVESAAKDLQNAKAEFAGAHEELKLNYKSRLLQSQRALSIAETGVQNARRRLHLLGLSKTQIDNLHNEKEEDVGILELRAPIAGTVLDKMTGLGERVEEGKDAFLIADLSTLWLNVRINPTEAQTLTIGQLVNLTIPGSDTIQAAKIAALSPILDEKTRTVTARLVLENKTGALRPGTFVTAGVVLSENQAPIAVPLSAVQTIEGKTVVFVEGDESGEFRVQPVLLGATDEKMAEVKVGLEVGKKVVVRNSFTLKAELGKGSED